MTDAAPDVVVYGGFWRRLGAIFIDVALMVPVASLLYMIERQNRTMPLILILPNLAFAAWYSIFLVVRLGGTPGKLAMGLRITMLDGRPVTLRAAALRHSVDFAFVVISTVVVAVATTKLPEATFFTSNFIDRARALEPFYPRWYDVVDVAGSVWMWSELVVLLTNRKRRALHDFIAGTVVIRRTGDRTYDPVQPSAQAEAA